MKGQLLYKILFVSILLPFHIFAQPAPLADKDITGLWKGSLYNDSTKQTLPYEITISEDAGKLSGYSYTLFDIDGKKELGVKRINITRKNDELIIEDVGLISNTYSAPPPKRVRQQSVVHLFENDTAMQLTGKWSTNRTRQYLPLTGSLLLEQAIDFRPMTLFKLLETLKLDTQLSFVKPEKTPPTVALDDGKGKSEISIGAHPTAIELMPVDKSLLEVPGVTSPEKPLEKLLIKDVELIKTTTSEELANISRSGYTIIFSTLTPVSKEALIAHNNFPVEKLVVKDIQLIRTTPSAELVKVSRNKPLVIINAITPKRKEALVPHNNFSSAKQPLVDKTVVASALVKKEKPAAQTVQQAVAASKPVAIITPPVNKPAPVAVIKEPAKTSDKISAVTPGVTEQKKDTRPVNALAIGQSAALNVLERKMKNEQSVFFESDSLVLTLYDNGDVDGDTVSVLMNGQIIFAKQGLSTKANSKTIYVGKEIADSISMVMYAENLGSIPPNTGLLVIMDGDKRYEVRFSADLKTNAAILLRRKSTKK